MAPPLRWKIRRQKALIRGLTEIGEQSPLENIHVFLLFSLLHEQFSFPNKLSLPHMHSKKKKTPRKRQYRLGKSSSKDFGFVLLLSASVKQNLQRFFFFLSKVLPPVDVFRCDWVSCNSGRDLFPPKRCHNFNDSEACVYRKNHEI